MKTTNLLAASALLSVLAAGAQAEDLRKVAEANNRGFIHAMKTKDIGWFNKIASSDFYTESQGKKTNRADSIKKMSQMFSVGNFSEISTRVLKVTPQGSGMIVRVKAHVVMFFQAPNGKKPSKMVGDTTYDEKWTKDHGQWKTRWLKTLTDTGTIDGKPMPRDM